MGMFLFYRQLQFVLLCIAIFSTTMTYSQTLGMVDELTENEKIFKRFQEYGFPQRAGDGVWLMNFNLMPMMEAKVLLTNNNFQKFKVEKDLVDGLYLFGNLPDGLYRLEIQAEVNDTIVFRFAKESSRQCQFKLVNSMGEIYFYPTEFGFFPYDKMREMLHLELDSLGFFSGEEKDSIRISKTRWFLENYEVDLKSTCYNSPRNEGKRQQFFLDLDSTFLKVKGLNVLGRCDVSTAIHNSIVIDFDFLEDEYNLMAMLQKYHFELVHLKRELSTGAFPLLVEAEIKYTKSLSMNMLEDLKSMYLEFPIYGIHLKE
jgi:hypothetical protein